MRLTLRTLPPWNLVPQGKYSISHQLYPPLLLPPMHTPPTGKAIGSRRRGLWPRAANAIVRRWRRPRPEMVRRFACFPPLPVHLRARARVHVCTRSSPVPSTLICSEHTNNRRSLPSQPSQCAAFLLAPHSCGSSGFAVGWHRGEMVPTSAQSSCTSSRMPPSEKGANAP